MKNSLREFQNIENKESDWNSNIAEEISNNGAVIIRNLIPKEDAVLLKSALENCIKEDEENLGRDYLFFGMIHALMNRDQCFLDLLENKTILQIMRTILGHGCIIHGYNSSSMPPTGTNFSRDIHVDCPRLVPNYITNVGLTIACTEFSDQNGAMEIMPKSFCHKDAPKESTFSDEKVVLNNLSLGDAVLFNARCWHRGGNNKTNEWRHAVTMNVCRAYMRQQFDFPKMLGYDKTKMYSNDLRQILGYNVRMPSSMEEFLYPAEKRLYQPGQE